MKKALSLILALGLCLSLTLSLCACGDGETKEEITPSIESSISTTVTEPTLGINLCQEWRSLSVPNDSLVFYDDNTCTGPMDNGNQPSKYEYKEDLDLVIIYSWSDFSMNVFYEYDTYLLDGAGGPWVPANNYDDCRALFLQKERDTIEDNAEAILLNNTYSSSAGHNFTVFDVKITTADDLAPEVTLYFTWDNATPEAQPPFSNYEGTIYYAAPGYMDVAYPNLNHEGENVYSLYLRPNLPNMLVESDYTALFYLIFEHGEERYYLCIDPYLA